MKLKTGVLLVNLGTPDSPNVSDVRVYLRQFLMDGRVLDIPFWQRFLLVNLIIAPFRSFKSAKVYKELWTEKGSPLYFYGKELTQLVQDSLGEDYVVSLGMRYQNPSIKLALDALKDKGLEKIIVLPLFPQYASASTGSAHQEVLDVISKWLIIPKIVLIDAYSDNPKMIKTFAELGRKYMEKEKFDHFIFSYHGLPERQLIKADPEKKCINDKKCCDTFHANNRLCYRAQCFETSRLLAQELGFSADQYTVSFQSRLGNTPWIKPYTDDLIKELVAKGKKRILAFSPSFTADCLETTIEIGEEYKELFESLGGEHWQLVESLNTHPLWVETVKEMVLAH
ncbi:MAG: ferrochelatase [Bacteroidetes bacterium]|nr:MAG: ferrochelatase [Bacteroidota bacterium]